MKMGDAEHQSKFSPEFKQDSKEPNRIPSAGDANRHAIASAEQLASADGIGNSSDERRHELCF